MSRLREPSTWAGVSGAAAALAGAPLALLAPVQPWLALLSALAGVVAVYLASNHPAATRRMRPSLMPRPPARNNHLYTMCKDGMASHAGIWPKQSPAVPGFSGNGEGLLFALSQVNIHHGLLNISHGDGDNPST